MAQRRQRSQERCEPGSRTSSSVPDAISAVLGIAGDFFSGFLIVFAITFICIFLLGDVANLKRALGSVLMPRRGRALAGSVGRVTTSISRWAIGVVVIAAIRDDPGGHSLAARFGYAIATGVIAGLLDMIPNIGATIAEVILVPDALGRAGADRGTDHARGHLLVYQQVENNVLTPKIQGVAVSLSGFFIIVAVTLFGALLGVLGAYTAVPLAATIQIFVRS